MGEQAGVGQQGSSGEPPARDDACHFQRDQESATQPQGRCWRVRVRGKGPSQSAPSAIPYVPPNSASARRSSLLLDKFQ